MKFQIGFMKVFEHNKIKKLNSNDTYIDNQEIKLNSIVSYYYPLPKLLTGE